jgi:flagellar hook-basal body complex protein FliE
MNIYTTTGVGFSSGMPKPLGSTTANPLRLKTLHERHMQISSEPEDPETVATTFAEALNQALGNVETLSQKSEDLTRKAIYDPDSVEAHEVIIASQKARFALNLTKTIADGAVRTFRELTNPR